MALLLRLGDARYRVASSAGCEVAPTPPLASLPGAPPWLAGVVVYKGEALPAVVLSPLLDAAQAADRRYSARMFVTRDAGFAVAFLVDDVDPDDGREDAIELNLEQLGRALLARSARGAAVP